MKKTISLLLSIVMVLGIFSGMTMSVSAATQYQLYWPVPTNSAAIGKYSSPFGPRNAPTSGASTNHRGIDIPVKSGTPVYAAYDGEVVTVSKSNLRGNYVLVYHSSIGLSTLYQHLTSATVQKGDKVTGGTQIAISGNTGIGTGAHLHFGVMVGKATKADNDQVSYNMAINPLGSNISYTAASGAIIVNSDNPDDYSYPTRDLFYTSPVKTGSDVKWVQAVLLKLGYEIAIDGSFGPVTRDVVKQFQQDKGLTVDGSCGPATRAKLLDCWNAKKNGSIPITLHTWLSNNEFGATPDEYVTGDWLYLNYKLFDSDTMCGIDSEINKSYSVLVELYGPDGKVEHSATYNNDNNWISIRRWKSGKYIGKVTVTGDVIVTGNVACNVVYDCTLQASSTNISLHLNGTNTASIRFTPSGGYPGSRRYSWSGENGVVSVSGGGWSSDSSYFTLNFTGLKYGSNDLTVNLHEDYTDNKTVVATIPIHIFVDANKYTISYNANGGSGAPSYQTKYYATDIALSSVVPTKSYTITYNANGGTVSTASKVVNCTFNNWKCSYNGSTYNPSGVYSINANTTMTAQWTNPTVGDFPIPTRTGYTFEGWFTAANGGTQISFSSTVTGDLTLHAHWTQNDTTKPNGLIESTNNVANIQEVTLSMSDNVGLAGYYWGTSSSTSPTFTNISGTSKTVNVTVSSSGTYYLTIKDTSGNIYQISKTFYNTTLNANGGSVSSTNIITASGNSFTFPTPTKSNYSYVGWSTSSSATSGMKTLTPTSNTTYYAVWDYVDTVKPIGSISSTNNVASNQTVTLTISDNVGLAGYYWGTNRDNPTFTSISGTNKTVNITVSSSGTYFLIVKDTSGNINQSSMTFYQTILNANEGVVSPSSIITASGNSFTLPTPTRNGFTYDGWATSKNDTIGVNALTPTENRTYYAVWHQNILLGDVNGDGEIDAADAGLISRYDAGFITLTAEQLQAGDVNKDGEVDAADAGLISRYDAGFISSLG